MDIERLIAMLEAEFEEVEAGTLRPDTVFVEMKEWCSLYALTIMAMVSTEFGMDLSGHELGQIRTVADLHQYISEQRTA